jgi:hypothetical protein
MFKQQNGRCAICLEKEIRILNGKIVKLAVDHDHKTGKVRELLCAACNAGIGMFKDSFDIAEKAAVYLRYHRGEQSVTGP